MHLSKKGNWKFVLVRKGPTCKNRRTAQSEHSQMRTPTPKCGKLPESALQYFTTLTPFLNFADADRMSVAGPVRNGFGGSMVVLHSVVRVWRRQCGLELPKLKARVRVFARAVGSQCSTDSPDGQVD